ncbi:MAG: PLP-dependent aminotransferase family protein [Hyphomicrobiaceae bacterium]
MIQSTSSAAILSISLDRDLKDPLHGQLASQFRKLILERRFGAGERLPSSRMLADELSVSRVTVTTAFDQLISEGYAEGRHGSGVYVAADLPDYTFSLDHRSHDAIDDDLPAPRLLRPFETSAPDLESFPYRDWARLIDQVWRAPEPALLAKPDPFGWGPLRRAIASHLKDWRGVECAPSQIVITSGLTDAIELIAKTALVEGDTVLVEEPGHHVLRNALSANGMMFKPVPVDENGFDIQFRGKKARNASAVVVTPSRQFPMGMTLPLARRLELLEWAGRRGGLIIEDDFDSEYRFVGQPLPALMSLDDQECVIYVGSFSKVLMPSLRLGFVVLPRRLLSNAGRVIGSTGARASLLAQPALQRFMETGGFATHIRRMRRLYAQRQRVLVSTLKHYADGLLHVESTSGGMHVVADFTPMLSERMTDIEAAERAGAAGITASALSTYFAGTPLRQGLVLGYASFDEASIRSTAARLARVLGSKRK